MKNLKRINETYKYNQENIVFKVNNEQEINEICDYIDKYYNIKLNRRTHPVERYPYPNYFFIPTFINDVKIFNNDVCIFTTDSENDIEEKLIKYYKKNKDFDLNDILTIDDLDSYKSLVETGRKNTNFKKTYLNSRNIYESLLNNYRYPYARIIIEVKNNEDIKKITEYLEYTYNITILKIRNRSEEDFPNYVSIRVDELLNAIKYKYDTPIRCMFILCSESCDLNKVISIISDNNEELYDNDSIKYANIDDILTINDIDCIDSLLSRGTKLNINSYFKNSKNIYESISEYRYPFQRIIIWIKSYEDFLNIVGYINDMFKINVVPDEFENDRSYTHVAINVKKMYDIMENIQEEGIKSYMLFKYYSRRYFSSPENLASVALEDMGEDYFNPEHVLYMNELRFIKTLLNTGKKSNFKSIYTDNPTLIYESKITNVLNAFDLDDTLVFNKPFEENIKHLLLEFKTPIEIFYDKINNSGVDLSKLKYENGRIYFDDSKKDFEIREYDTDWIRKKDRVYLTQPDEYLLTDESLPISINDKLLDIYNSSENKCIITARLSTSKDNIKKRLNKLGISHPNYGLFMLNDKYSNKVIFKCNTLLKLQEQFKFDKINYYDDNIKLLKKMKIYLSDKNININLYKVTENDIRKV